jgi:small subunit ribosomal protein S5
MNNQNVNNEEKTLLETLVHVGRVTKVVTGGRKFSFSSCVVVGNKKGMVGYGSRKAKEVSDARTKASQAAKKNLIHVPLLENRTIFHDVTGKAGAAKVILRRASPGTGIIAGGPMRAIFDLLGIQDIVTKSIGSSNVYNIIAATFDALSKLSSPKQINDRRG